MNTQWQSMNILESGGHLSPSLRSLMKIFILNSRNCSSLSSTRRFRGVKLAHRSGTSLTLLTRGFIDSANGLILARVCMPGTVLTHFRRHYRTMPLRLALTSGSMKTQSDQHIKHLSNLTLIQTQSLAGCNTSRWRGSWI